MKKSLALALILALVTVACGDSDSKKEGCLNCPCKTGNTCEGTLVCTNNVCVATCTPGTLDCPCKTGNTCEGTLVCTNNVCVPCTAGSLGCSCKTNDSSCDQGLECTTCKCCSKGTVDYTPNYITVEGMAFELSPTSSPGKLSIALAAVSPMDALFNPVPKLLAGGTSASDGAFKLDCFDVGKVALGLIIRADDTGNTYFPAYTGIAGWTDPTKATCLTGSRVFALKTEVVTQLAGLINATYPNIDPDFDAAEKGIILGMTMGPGPTGMPMAGATVLKEVPGGDPVAIDNICYVTPDNTTTPPSLKCGTQTWVGGLFVIPGPFKGDPVTSPPTIIPQKTGCTWDSGRFTASSADGKAFILALPANSCS